MLHQLPAGDVTDAIDEVLSVPAEAELEPVCQAASLSDGDPHTITIQRGRFPDSGSVEETVGMLLFSLTVPYEQLPTTSPVIPSDPAHDGTGCLPPPGTSPSDVVPDADPTPLGTLGPEHRAFVEDCRKLFDAIPAIEDEPTFEPDCIGFDGETASFGGEVELAADRLDPAAPVPELLRQPERPL